MELLLKLPGWVFYTLTITGLLGLLFTFLLKKITFVAIYAQAIQSICLVVFLFGVFMIGAFETNKNWLEKEKEFKSKLAEAEAQVGEKTVEIIEKIVYKNKIVKEKGDDIIKYIQVQAPTIDEQCKIPKELIEDLNKMSEAK